MSNLQTIFLCDPGGNQTYIVANENKEIGSANIGGVHHRILQKFPKLEQGGYLVPPKFSTSAARLEMAGGEFCGTVEAFVLPALQKIGNGEARENANDHDHNH